MRTKRWGLAALAVMSAAPVTAGAQCLVGAMGGGTTPLVLRLPEGESRRSLATTDQTMTQTLMGQEQTTHQVLRTRIRYDVLAPGEDGQRRVRITYEGTHVEMDAPMAGYTWDSDSTASVPQGAEVFAALVGKGYTFAMNPDGTNQHVEGWDSLLTTLLDALPVPPGVSADDLKEMVKKNVGENLMGGAMRQAIAAMPPKLGVVGDTWSCTADLGGSFGMHEDASWTVDSREGGVSKVKVTSQTRSDSTATMSMGPMTIRYAVTGTTTGTLEIDDATGWIVRSRMESQMSGTATMEGSPMGPMEVPMTTKIVTTTEPVTGS